MKNFLIVVFATLFLTACGGDEDEQGKPEKKAAAPATQKEMQSATGGKQKEEMMVVDHTMDEIEFELKRSLGGVERMIEQYKEEGIDTAELEARKKELEKKLKELVSG